MYLVRIASRSVASYTFLHINPNKPKLRVVFKKYDIFKAEMNELGNISKLILLNDSNYTCKARLLKGVEPKNYKQFDNLYDVISYLLSLL